MMMMMSPHGDIPRNVIRIWCGARCDTYTSLVTRHPHKFRSRFGRLTRTASCTENKKIRYFYIINYMSIISGQLIEFYRCSIVISINMIMIMIMAYDKIAYTTYFFLRVEIPVGL